MELQGTGTQGTKRKLATAPAQPKLIADAIESAAKVIPGNSVKHAYESAIYEVEDAMRIILPPNNKDARVQKEVAVDAAKKKFNLVLKAIKNTNDVEFLRTALTWQRSRRFIERSDDAWLSEVEALELTDMCKVIAKTPASFHATLHEEYTYKKYFDEKALTYMYITYIKRVISPEEQLGKNAAWKMSQNMQLLPEDFPDPKDQYIRIPLSEKQWLKFFKPI